MTVDFSEVTVADVGRHFGRRRALTQVSFAAGAGEIVGLLGPNGAGKSTLLAILATLLSASTGAVHYGAHTAQGAGAALRARLGLLGHDLFLYPELTARENLTFFARLYGITDIDGVIERSLTHANLYDRADDIVSGFSRGMRQRLALERALVHAPRLLLLDEPFTGLDAASATTLTARLDRLRQDGCIIVMATHDLDLAAGLLTRVLFLRNGRVVDEVSGSRDLRRTYGDLMSMP